MLGRRSGLAGMFRGRLTQVGLPVPVIGPAVIEDYAFAGGTAGTVDSPPFASAGANRYIIAIVGAGTSDSVSDISANIVSATGEAPMTRTGFMGTTTELPEGSLEAFAWFAIAEADLPPGDSFSIEATATGSNVPDKLGVWVVALEDVPNEPTFYETKVPPIDVTLAKPGLVIGLYGSSTYSSGTDFIAPLVDMDVVYDYGDGLLAASATLPAGTHSISVEDTGRDGLGVFTFE